MFLIFVNVVCQLPLLYMDGVLAAVLSSPGEVTIEVSIVIVLLVLSTFFLFVRYVSIFRK